MRSNFETATAWLLVHEGGYVDHPRDPGGATNRGVTQAVYDAWRRSEGLSPQPVRAIDQAEVLAIYKRQYWDAVRGDDLPAGLDYAVYDFAVNSGASRAAKFLQRIVGVAQDGVIGALTLEAVRAAGDPKAIIADLCTARLAWMKRLKTWGTFGRGWTRRVMGDKPGFSFSDTGVIDRAIGLADGYAAPAPKRAAPGAARDEDMGEIAKQIDIINDAAPQIGTAATAAGGVITALGLLDWRVAALIVVLVAAAGAVAWFTKRRR